MEVRLANNKGNVVFSNAIWPASWIALASTAILESLLVYVYLKWNSFVSEFEKVLLSYSY